MASPTVDSGRAYPDPTDGRGLSDGPALSDGQPLSDGQALSAAEAARLVRTRTSGPPPSRSRAEARAASRSAARARRQRRRQHHRQRRKVAWRVLVAAMAGLLVFAGYAPSSTWWTPLLGFALLGMTVHRTSWKASAGLGLVFGVALFFPLLSWTNIYVGNVPWIGLAGAEALLTMPAVALIGPASRRLPAWPVWAAAAWVAGETLRAIFPFGGFPWGGIAFTQPDGPLLPIVAVLGETGLAFATALAGFALGELLRRAWARWRASLPGRVVKRGRAWAIRRSATFAARFVLLRWLLLGRTLLWPVLLLWRSWWGHGRESPGTDRHYRLRATLVALAVPALLLVLPFAAGIASRPAVQTGAGAPTAPIAVVQGNVPEPGLEFNARRRAVLDMHAAETAKLAADVAAGTVPAPRLVIWPENSSDIDPYRNPDAAAVIDKAAKQMGVPILVGAVVGADQPNRAYNMGIVWDPVTGPGATYTKRHPVPFAEYIPWRGFFRIFSDKVDLVQTEFLPGHRPGNLDIAGVPVGDVICFEIVEDDLVRDVVNGGAQVLVVQTNNATFGYSDETYQQQAMSRVRAVEYGREVLIAATSGVSAVIRPDGSVQSTVPLFTPGHLVPQVPLISATTPGTVLGAPVLWVLTAACPLGLAGAVLLARRRRGVAASWPMLWHRRPAARG